MCPGSFTNGLNSAERGEGRWAQNYAVMLAKAGHDVYAASGGGKDTTEYGVKLINQSHSSCKRYEPYDLYFDAAWWDNKTPAAESKKYVTLKWAPEDYLRHNKLPDNLYVGYPYVHHRYNFTGNLFSNENRAFPLPTMFCDEFSPPNWDKESIFIPGKIDTNRPYTKYLDAIYQIIKEHRIEGRSRNFFKQQFGDRLNLDLPQYNWQELTPYNSVIDSLSRSKISMPILNPGCVIEAACMGVPSIMWEHGGFFNSLSKDLNILLEHDAEPERLLFLVDYLMTSRKNYMEIVRTLQDYFSGHTFKGSLYYFNLMAQEIELL